MSDLKDSTLECIVCQCRLKPAIDETMNQPKYGTEFTSRGHYGSRVTDLLGKVTFIINVCDTCILEAIREDRCRAAKPIHQPTKWERIPISFFDHLDRDKVQ